GKHLLGEKPFGIDLAANNAINAAISAHPELFVRCSSEFPFFPGGQEALRFVRERRFGRVLEVRSQFLHSSDLDPTKPINWKRRAELNGEYGCMGDLGMHALQDRKSTRLNSSHEWISYAVFCLKKKKKITYRDRKEKQHSTE